MYRSIAAALMLPLLLASGLARAMDPPEKMWEREYEATGSLWDIETVPSGGYIVAVSSGEFYGEDYLYRLNEDGDVLWWMVMPGYSGLTCKDVDILDDGSFIATGGCDYYVIGRLFLSRVSADGDTIWTKIFDNPTTREAGFQVKALPDGGFAAAGRGYSDAWILRANAEGDTLWTDVWGWGQSQYNDAFGVQYDSSNDWIVALTYGRDNPGGTIGPHLVYYSPEGAHLFTTEYPELAGQVSRDLCRASDGGYTFTSVHSTQGVRLTHTDCNGDLMWIREIDHNFYGEILGLERMALDDGYMISGAGSVTSTNTPACSEGIHTGRLCDAEGASLVRLDVDGNVLWELSEDHGAYYSTIQLPQGGYVAAGNTDFYSEGNGLLVHYAPETGIVEEPPRPEGPVLGVAPNPFCSYCAVGFEVSDACDARLELYDLSGRLVDSLMDGHVGAGSHEARIEGSGLSPGIYLLRLRAGDRSMVRRVVLVR
jgi:hypothetical protein